MTRTLSSDTRAPSPSRFAGFAAFIGTSRPAITEAPAEPPTQPRTPTGPTMLQRIARALGVSHLVGLPPGPAVPNKAPPGPLPARPAAPAMPRQPAGRAAALTPPRVATTLPPARRRAAAPGAARAVEAARAAGYAKGMQAGRERWRTIFEASRSAAGNLHAYAELAGDPSVTVAAAVAALEMLAPARGLRRPDRAARNPAVGPGLARTGPP